MACKFCGKPWSLSETFYSTTENESICHDCFIKNKFRQCFVSKKIITKPGFKCDWSKCKDCDYYYKKLEKGPNFMKYFVIGWVILAVIAIGISSCEDKNEFEDVFRKDPNTWTEREKEHINNYFDWLEEQN